MKLAHLDILVVGNPPPGFGGRYFIFVKLTTDNGISGIGEIYCDSFGPQAIKAMTEDVFGRYVHGIDPFHIESLWRKVYSSGYSQRPDPSLIGVLSGIEIALWDILGKATDKPVYELLGGRVHEKLRSYTYIYPQDGEDESIYHNAELSAKRAAEYVKLGFTALKFDPFGSTWRTLSTYEFDLSLDIIRAVREAVGPSVDLLIEGHCRYNVPTAIQFAEAMAPLRPTWFEEPVPHTNIPAMIEFGNISRVLL